MPWTSAKQKNLAAATLATDEGYVRQPQHEPGPAVLLLGCSTELTTIPFYNFVAGFKQSGASLVLGTLATIHGRHAARLVSRFVQSLKKYVGKPEARFGEPLLAVKARCSLRATRSF
jgi:hypothetical protein